ncbi:carbohydrate kinase [Escherichia coli]|nr:carbohydrate kinase [Escherichia coli]EMB0770615.1 carbohydrate kinase [Escherichia coli]HCL8849279.1 carbohydrate kinase [Escherichia coli]
MHRIDTKTAQKDKFGAGKNGFTRGNPQTGTPATDLDDDYFDMLQEELCSVVEASGASLEKARHDQLLTALRALLLSRKNPFGDIKSDGTVKTALENLGLVDDSGVVGRLLNTQVITSSGTYTPTPGTRKIKVILTGGGGGGSSVIATSFSQTAFGGGGGSAATCIGIFDLEDISDFSVVIGAGGTAGNPGGTSTFNGMSAGRGGGGSGVNTPATGTGGAAGTATGGLINIHGGHGSDGQLGSYYSFGNGAASFWGGGGRAGAANGIAAKAYGAGGGAAYDTSFSGALKAGGTGAPGVCVIEEFA